MECRLIRPDSCPYQGARKDSCECFFNRQSTGTTSFQKIRLNVTSLRVDSNPDHLLALDDKTLVAQTAKELEHTRDCHRVFFVNWQVTISHSLVWCEAIKWSVTEKQAIVTAQLIALRAVLVSIYKVPACVFHRTPVGLDTAIALLYGSTGLRYL